MPAPARAAGGLAGLSGRPRVTTRRSLLIRVTARDRDCLLRERRGVGERVCLGQAWLDGGVCELEMGGVLVFV